MRWLLFQFSVSVGAGGRFLPFCLHQGGKLVKQRHDLFACSWGGECVISTAEKEMVLYRLLVTEKAKACLLLPPHHWSDCWVDMDQYLPFLLTPPLLFTFSLRLRWRGFTLIYVILVLPNGMPAQLIRAWSDSLLCALTCNPLVGKCWEKMEI